MVKAARFQGPVQRQSAPYPESQNLKESAMRKLLLLVLYALCFAASPVLAALSKPAKACCKKADISTIL